jgi:glycosyltransferase involved in cell wall biosynthesis
VNVAYRPHILSFVEDLAFGGDEARLLAFARSIDHTRFRHTIATIRRPDPDDGGSVRTMHRHFADAGLVVRPLTRYSAGRSTGPRSPLGIARAPLILLQAARALRRVIREEGVDLIDAHLNAANLVGTFVGRMTRTPVVVTLYHTRPHVRYRALTSLAIRFALVRAQAIVTDSRQRRDEMQAFVRRESLPVAVIPNGVYPCTTERSTPEMRRALGLPEDPTVRVIGQVSRLAAFKGHSVLLRAARAVVDAEPRTCFLFVGFDTRRETNRRRLEAEIGALDLGDHVRMVAYPGPIADVWKAIDIHVHASLFDSLPNAVIEAMSLGKPTVVTSVGGIPEMAQHESTALVVPPGDAAALADALLRLLRDPRTAARLGAAARARYEEAYRPEIMTTRLQELFLQVLAA